MRAAICIYVPTDFFVGFGFFVIVVVWVWFCFGLVFFYYIYVGQDKRSASSGKI